MRRTAALVTFILYSALAAAEPPLAEKYLHDGKLADGVTALAAHLEHTPGDDQARFGLGFVQFVRAVERLGQAFHRHGLRPGGLLGNVPFLRLPVPANPDPTAITHAAADRILRDFVGGLTKAEATLAAVRDDGVKLPLRVGLIRLDLTGGGKAGEAFRDILARYVGGRQGVPADPDLLIAFDRGDVAWLRGYCHLLMAMGEFVLAHDGRELFERTAHLAFPKVETPHAFLATRPANDGNAFGFESLADAIAVIHLMRMPVREPGRMKAALVHLEQMLALSRESWKFILAETDDDHEWIPNPRQKGALGVPVRQEMIDGWLGFVDEAEALLAGKRLVPFWRTGEPRGVNLRRVFTEPREFDLVLWVQGTAATPYLEAGETTRRDVWDRLLRVFGGDFIGFALWFN